MQTRRAHFYKKGLIDYAAQTWRNKSEHEILQ